MSSVAPTRTHAGNSAKRDSGSPAPKRVRAANSVAATPGTAASPSGPSTGRKATDRNRAYRKYAPPARTLSRSHDGSASTLPYRPSELGDPAASTSNTVLPAPRKTGWMASVTTTHQATGAARPAATHLRPRRTTSAHRPKPAMEIV